MPTFCAFHLEEALQAYPLALAAYQRGKRPFGLQYVQQPAMRRLHYLQDMYDQHDGLRLQSKMRYSSTRVAQTAVKHAADTEGLTALKQVVKTLNHDRPYYWQWVSRKHCHSLQTNAAWEQLKQQKRADIAQLNALQQAWQPHIKFACYTVNDFDTALDLITELEAYYTLASQELDQKAEGLPAPFKAAYRDFLIQLSHTLDQEKKTLSLALWHFLTTLAPASYPLVDNRFSQVTLPVLQSLKYIPKPIPLPSQQPVTPAFFDKALAFLTQAGDSTLKERLVALPLFKLRAHSPFAIQLVLWQHAIQLMPVVLHTALSIAAQQPWYVTLFDYSTARLMAAFDTRACFRLLEIEAIWQRLEAGIAAKPESPDEILALLATLEECDTRLQQEAKRINAYRQGGIIAWFYTRLNHFIKTWQESLIQQQSELQRYRLIVATQVATLAKARQVAKLPLWPPAVLNILNDFFQQTAQRMQSVTTPALKQQWVLTRQTFVEATDYLHVFLQATLNPDAFEKTVNVIASVTAERISSASVEKELATFQAHLTEAQTQALAFIKGILTQTEYPKWEAWDKALDSLFQSQRDSQLAKKQFNEAFIRTQVLPIRNAYCPAVYEWVKGYDAELAQQWQQECAIDNDEVMAFFKYLLTQTEDQEIVFNLFSQPILLNGRTVYPILPTLSQYLQALRWQPSSSDTMSRLHALANQYVKAYSGSNTTYQDLITAIAHLIPDESLLIHYGQKRFDYLIAHHQHALVAHERFLLKHQQLPALNAHIQHCLTDYLQTAKPHWDITIAEIFNTFGTLEQRLEYRKQLDTVRLKALRSLLKTHTDVEAAHSYIAGIQRAREPDFPASEHAAFHALFQPEAYKAWSPMHHCVIIAFGDTSLQAYNCYLWLQALVSQTESACAALKEVASLGKLANVWDSLSDAQCDAVIHQFECFLKQYHGNDPEVFNVIQTLMTPALQARYPHIMRLWQSQQEAQHLREAMQALSQALIENLTHKRYKEALSQFEFIQAKLQANQANAERKAIIEATLAQLVEQFNCHVKTLIFEAPVDVVFFNSRFLQYVSWDVSQTKWLCEEADVIKTTYDDLLLDLQYVISRQAVGSLVLDKPSLQRARQGFSLAQKQQLDELLIQAAEKLANNMPPAKAALLAFKRLLLDESTCEAQDEACIVQFAEMIGNRTKHQNLYC